MRLIFLPIVATLFFACNDSGIKDRAELPVNSGEIRIISGDMKTDNISPFISYNVRGENIVKYAPDGEETPLTKEIGANVVIRNTPYESIHKSLLSKRLSKEFIVNCSACHDDYGNGVIGPSLLTLSANEIADMIYSYKTKKGKNILMEVLVSKMTDKEIKLIADDIAKFNEEIREETKR